MTAAPCRPIVKTMEQTNDWTIGRLLTWTTDYLKRRGADSPRLDAEVLLAHARRCQRIDLYARYGELPDESDLSSFRELVRRRAEGVPVAYLVGQREFFSLSFRVTPDVLIPRPETEHLVVALLDLIQRRDGGQACEVADVGTGSGIIAVCAARHAKCRVTATDISAAALAVARENVERHDVADRVELLQGDLLSMLPDTRQFDFVVSNPPYVAQGELASLAPDVREHEPHVALEAGRTGTDVIARLVPQAAKHLRPGGWLLLEISPMIASDVADLVASSGQFEAGSVQKDTAGLPRVFAAQRGSSEPAS